MAATARRFDDWSIAAARSGIAAAALAALEPSLHGVNLVAEAVTLATTRSGFAAAWLGVAAARWLANWSGFAASWLSIAAARGSVAAGWLSFAAARSSAAAAALAAEQVTERVGVRNES